jgi:hypothetical protein
VTSDESGTSLVQSGPARLGRSVASLEFTVLHRRVVVEFEGLQTPSVLGPVQATFADLRPRPVSGREPDILLDTDVDGLDRLLERLGQDLCLWGIHDRRGDLLMLHACGVSDPATGATVGLVGPSGMGKSTAAALLGRRWGYVSDELLAIDVDLTVVPFPKPLSIVVPGRAVKDQVRAADLGLLVAPPAPHLVGLLLLDRRPEPGVAVEALATVDALALLTPQVSYLAHLPRPLHRVAETLHRVGGLRRVTYHQTEDLQPVVADLLGAAT